MPLTPEQKRERRAADKRALEAGDEGALKRQDAHATRMREARLVEKVKRAENDAAACGRAKKDKERMVEARRIDKLALEEGDDDALERSAKDKFRSETVQAANKLIEEIVREEANNVLVEYVEAEYRECMKCIESFQVDIDKNVPAYKSFEEIRYEVYARRNWTRSRIYEWHQEMHREELKSNAVRICEVYQSHACIFLRNSRRLSLLREPHNFFAQDWQGLVAEPLYHIWKLHKECHGLLELLHSHVPMKYGELNFQAWENKKKAAAKLNEHLGDAAEKRTFPEKKRFHAWNIFSKDFPGFKTAASNKWLKEAKEDIEERGLSTPRYHS
jgi:hypothetical protein